MYQSIVEYKIISGGQTGADQGALDAALELNHPCGGWCPKGRKSEPDTALGVEAGQEAWSVCG